MLCRTHLKTFKSLITSVLQCTATMAEGANELEYIAVGGGI